MSNNLDHEARLRMLALLDSNVGSVVAVKRRLQWYVKKVVPFYPVTESLLAKAADALEDEVFAHMDGLIKKFEQLLLLLQDSLFKAVATLDNDPSSVAARRDLTNYMEKIGCVKSASRFSDIAMLRNRLAHEYPNSPTKQAELVNSVIVASEVLFEVAANIVSYVDRRRPIWSQP